jgi:hypothetical protein
MTRLKKSRKRSFITYNASSAKIWGTIHLCALLSLKARRRNKTTEKKDMLQMKKTWKLH